MPTDLPSCVTRPKHHRGKIIITTDTSYLWRRVATGSRWREHIITVLLGGIKTERHIPGTLRSPADCCFGNERFQLILFVWRFSLLSVSAWDGRSALQAMCWRSWEKQKRAKTRAEGWGRSFRMREKLKLSQRHDPPTLCTELWPAGIHGHSKT